MRLISRSVGMRPAAPLFFHTFFVDSIPPRQHGPRVYTGALAQRRCARPSSFFYHDGRSATDTNTLWPDHVLAAPKSAENNFLKNDQNAPKCAQRRRPWLCRKTAPTQNARQFCKTGFSVRCKTHRRVITNWYYQSIPGYVPLN